MLYTRHEEQKEGIMTANQLKRILEILGELALEEFASYVRATCEARDATIGNFTLHETSHFSGVEQTLEILLKHQKPLPSQPETDQTRPPSYVEQLILRFCCWGHDVGMLKAVSQSYHATGQAKHDGKP